MVRALACLRRLASLIRLVAEEAGPLTDLTSTDLTFNVRPHALSGEQTYVLTPDHIDILEAGKATRHIALSDITKVALSYMGTGDGQTYCTVKARGRAEFKIRSHHYESLGDFQDRHETFDPFARALCRAVAQANPAAKFVRGNWLYFGIWFGVFLASAGVAIGIALALLNQVTSGDEIGPDLVMGVIVGAGVALTTLGAAGANRVKAFDPDDPPLHEYA